MSPSGLRHPAGCRASLAPDGVPALERTPAPCLPGLHLLPGPRPRHSSSVHRPRLTGSWLRWKDWPCAKARGSGGTWQWDRALPAVLLSEYVGQGWHPQGPSALPRPLLEVSTPQHSQDPWGAAAGSLAAWEQASCHPAFSQVGAPPLPPAGDFQATGRLWCQHRKSGTTHPPQQTLWSPRAERGFFFVARAQRPQVTMCLRRRWGSLSWLEGVWLLGHGDGSPRVL